MKKETNVTRLEMLEETAESMKQSLSNIEKVQNEQNILLDLISRSDKKDFFTEFITETEVQISKMDDQKERLNKKYDCLLNVIKAYKNNDEIAKILEIFMEAIGLYE